MSITVIFPGPENVVIFDDNGAAASGEPLVVVLGTEGPIGPAGATGATGATGASGPSGTELTSKVAASALGGLRVVKIDSAGQAAYADPTVAADALAVIGVTVEAVNSGNPVNIRQFGEIVEPSWNWTVGQPIYAGLSGVLTQTLPVTGAVWLKTVGVATAATKMIVALQPPIVLA